MTVRELIGMLQCVDNQDATVTCEGPNGGTVIDSAVVSGIEEYTGSLRHLVMIKWGDE